MGGRECWWEDAPPEDRWRRMVDSECEEGKELARVWGRIRVEVAQCCNFLGEELPLVTATTTIGIGEGSVSGASQGLGSGGQGEYQG